MVVTPSVPAWDIFCKVVDNYGDAGVCWRVARLLHQEHGLVVRLWIDHPETLRALTPDLVAGLPVQQIGGVQVHDWSKCIPLPDSAMVVVEAFGCGLPETYISAMATLSQPPVWIVLDYLTAEAWADSHHGLASPHPSLGLPRWYFYPGFSLSTGGLPREHDLLTRRDAFGSEASDEFWRSLGFARPAPDALTLSLFAYADAPVTNLLSALAEGSGPVVAAVPAGVLLPALKAFCGHDVAVGDTLRRGELEIRVLPFLSQARYDELLWACDINFVRGEDSFVRAQWAGKPLVWQPYRQDDGAHQRKLDAFLEQYAAGLDSVAGAALTAFNQAWSAGGAVQGLWPALRAARGELTLHALNWSRKLVDLGEMSAKLVEFVRNKVK